MKFDRVKKYKFIIFLMSIIVIITFWISLDQIITRGKEITTLINSNASIDINNQINEKILLIESIGELNCMKNSSTTLQEKAFALKSFQEKYNLLLIGLIDKNGNASNSLNGGHYSLADREYFSLVKKTKKNVVSDVIISKSTGKENIVIVHPSLNSNKEFDGAIFASIKLTDLLALKNNHSIFEKGFSTNIFDENLKILEGDSSENFSQFKVNLFDKNQFNLFFEKENGSLHFAAFTKNI
ncbi:MAG: PDC sensor domain-containing protein, partial [Cetobacterium sp.]